MEECFFSSNGRPHPKHFVFAFYFALAFFVVRFFLDRFLLRRLAIWFLHTEEASSRITDARRATIRATIVKCTESMWKLTYYATVEACVLIFFYNEPWFHDPNLYFYVWPYQGLSLSLRLVYVCQWGFYIYSLAALLSWETKRKDFAVMMSHHVITVALIGFSYIASFYRIGIIVLALHDASDIFLEAAKIFKYAGKELGASICFGLFAISWLFLRLIFFPFWVIKTSSFEIVVYLDLSNPYDKSLYYGFNTMLLTLLVFHIYWWFLICSMIKRQLRNSGRVGDDIRSDSEEDE